jgi:hypothetical protein
MTDHGPPEKQETSDTVLAVTTADTGKIIWCVGAFVRLIRWLFRKGK